MYKIVGGDQKVYGPISAEQLRQWFSEGRINAATSILPDGATEWSPLSALPEFADLFVPGATTAPPLRGGASVPPIPPSPEATLARDYNLDIGDCISRSWTLVKANFWPVVGVSTLITIAYGVINQIPGIFTRPLINDMIEYRRFSLPGFLIIVGASMLATPFYNVLMAGQFNYYLKLIRGQDATVADAFSGFKNFLQLALLGLVMGLLIWIGICLCVLPGIYLSVAWYFAMPLVIDRGMGFWEAMEFSRKVASKHWFTVFALIVVIGLLAIAGVCACCIGILVTMPIAWVALMYAYEDIFSRRTA
jgi:hypothetical protein